MLIEMCWSYSVEWTSLWPGMARSTSIGDREVAVVYTDNIQEWSSHTEKLKAGQAINFHTLELDKTLHPHKRKCEEFVPIIPSNM